MVDSLLVWANGLEGKMSRLVLPLLKGQPKRHQASKKLYGAAIKEVSRKRNEIVHGGHFCSKKEAIPLIATCKIFVEDMVRPYHEDFKLSDPGSL